MKRIMRAFKINEISAVDRPAQPEARALIMKRAEPPVRKDMYGVGRFAEIIGSIGYLLRSSESEAEFEGDRSPVPAAIRAWLKQGLPVFRAMSAEETEELINAMVTKRDLSAGVPVEWGFAEIEAAAKSATGAEIAKREFDAKARRSAAASGAAEPDGSYPIENSSDLHNAMRAYGRSKNKAKTKAHIRSRAKALGLTSELGSSFKRDEGALSKLFAFAKGFGISTDALSESVKLIVADDTATNKAALIDETIAQFSDHVADEIEKTLSEEFSGVHSEGDAMSPAIMKALGLADTATDDDALKALATIKLDAEIAKAAMTDDEKSFHDKMDDNDAKKAFRGMSKEERAKKMKKSVDDMPEYVRKALADVADLQKRNAALEYERDVPRFGKRAVEIGLSEPQGELLMKAHAGDKDALAKIENAIKGLNEQIATGKVFAEFGTSRGGDVGAYDEITAKAQELRKADPKLTIEKAKARVIEDPANRDLVKRYNEERMPKANTRAA